jgi:hypothetical protein
MANAAMRANYPSFEEAAERLRSFLKSEGLPEEIVWVTPRMSLLSIGRFASDCRRRTSLGDGHHLDFPTIGERGIKGYAARSYSSGDR